MSSPAGDMTNVKMCARWIFMLTLSLVLPLLFAACESNPVTTVPISLNPYGFRTSDARSADSLLALALRNMDTLGKIAQQTVTNPYRATQSDIDYTNGLYQESQISINRYQHTLDYGNYDFFFEYYHFIPSQQQADEGRLYWTGERARTDTLSRPYWQKERSIAVVIGHHPWIDFCDYVISNLDYKIRMIDSTMKNFDADEGVLNATSGEGAVHILNRKISYERFKMGYYTDLVGVLNAARALRIPDWSGVSRLVPSLQQISERKAYWLRVIDSTEHTIVPYWKGQLRLAVSAGNKPWSDFCDHMIRNLGQLVDLGNQTRGDLELDRKIIVGESSEAPQAIVARKNALLSAQIAYYSGLAAAIREGRALGIIG